MQTQSCGAPRREAERLECMRETAMGTIAQMGEMAQMTAMGEMSETRSRSAAAMAQIALGKQRVTAAGLHLQRQLRS